MEENKNTPIRNKSIYVMISRTRTEFGRMLQRCGKLKYNHAAIVLDEDFDHIYAIARPKHRALFLGKVVRESLDRYVMKENYEIPIVAFKFELSGEEYDELCASIKKQIENPTYLYNTYSVLTMPIFKGFSVSRCFSCIEYVSYILKNLGYLDKKPCKYRPDDYLELFSDRIVYKGDIRGKVSYIPERPTYYDRLTFREVLRTVKVIAKITGRSIAQIFKKNATY